MKKVIFQPSSEEAQVLIQKPLSAKKYIPDWFKSIKPVDKNKPLFKENGMQINTNVKMCMPFLDTFTTGYIQETWSDLYIDVRDNDEGNLIVEVSFPVGPEMVSYRHKTTQVAITEEYIPIEFTWLQHWVPVLPDGYSMLYTHPLNRLDLPFTSLSGIVDHDLYNHELSGAYPFFLKKEFNRTIIPAGTPMFQMIPIKRESWDSDSTNFDLHESMRKKNFIRKKIFDGYRDMFWQKKEYN
jgi:hypothetical protein